MNIEHQRCRHRKLVFTTGGMIMCCPICGQQWQAIKKGGSADFMASNLNLGSNDIRVDPQNLVRG